MKSRRLLSSASLTLSLASAAVALAPLACSTAADPPAGLAGAAGSLDSAGASSAGTAGSVATAGASSGGASAGSAGSPQGGSSSAGSTGSLGGAAGASAGSGGASAGASGAAPVVDTKLVGAWDGALLQYPCGNSGSGYDCAQPSGVNCKKYDQNNNPVLSIIPPSGGAASSWTMGGVTGTTYDVTFRVRGVVEVNSFKEGTRAAGNGSVLVEPRNLFQAGGIPPANGDSTFDYNVFELDVTPAVSGAPNVYFLNSVTEGQNPHASSSPTVHKSFNVDYSATIKVPGGGKISLKVTDSNCVQIQNCGDSTGGQCASGARTVPLNDASPAAPAFAQPPANGNFFGQWVFFDVTKVAVAQ